MLLLRRRFKMRKYLVLFIGSLLSLDLQGCKESSLDNIKRKIVKVET